MIFGFNFRSIGVFAFDMFDAQSEGFFIECVMVENIRSISIEKLAAVARRVVFIEVDDRNDAFFLFDDGPVVSGPVGDVAPLLGGEEGPWQRPKPFGVRPELDLSAGLKSACRQGCEGIHQPLRNKVMRVTRRSSLSIA